MRRSFCGLFLGEPVHRDAGPLREHLGDLLLVDRRRGRTPSPSTLPRLRALGEQVRSWSRSWAARSNCCASTASSFVRATSAISALELLDLGEAACA